MPKPQSAAIYTRISSDPEGKRAGVERQRQDCQAWAERHGWKAVELYEDNDRSAYSGKPRPAYVKLLEDLKNGARDAVIAWHPDRLHRSPKELEEFIDVIDASGAQVAMIESGSYDLTTSDGRFVARTLGNVAKKESEDKSRRVRRKLKDNIEQGKPHTGGRRPFGFDYQNGGLVIRQSEARLVREASDRVLSGESLRSICSSWNRRGALTVTGAPWGPTVLRRMLTSARIAGLRQDGSEEPGTWSPIIDVETREELRAILLDPVRKRYRHQPVRTYLLTGGLARCGLCGGKLTARPDSGGRRKYVCSKDPDRREGCGGINVQADAFEELVAETTLLYLSTPAVLDGLRRDPVEADRKKELARELRTYEKRVERLKKEYAVEQMWTKAEFTSLREELDQHIERLTNQLAERTQTKFVGRLPSGAKALRRWWDEANIEQRHTLLAAVIERVDVGPAVRGRNFFDPERVNVVWRT